MLFNINFVQRFFKNPSVCVDSEYFIKQIQINDHFLYTFGDPNLAEF